jgi:hypothetical protein
VGVAVYARRGLSVRRVDQTEDLAGPLIYPIPQVVHTVLILYLEVLRVCVGYVRGRYPALHVVHIHEQ